jgi:hypothetical protein
VSGTARWVWAASGTMRCCMPAFVPQLYRFAPLEKVLIHLLQLFSVFCTID